MTQRMPINDIDYFNFKTYPEPNTGCFLWNGGLCHGYGTACINKKQQLAHRWSWELHRGPIPEGMDVLHKCDTPLCVNPDHLKLGTQKDNAQDMSRKGRSWQQKKTHCPKGHEYSQQNTWLDSNKHRHCRACLKILSLRRTEKNRLRLAKSQTSKV